MKQLIFETPKIQDNSSLQLSPITVDEGYLKKWNETSKNFVCLTKGGELVSNSLYRIGGLNNPEADIKEGKYFMLLKYVEAFYSDEIMKMSKSKESSRAHLDGRWVIIDKNGVEKVESTGIHHPYLTGGCIYSIQNNYYNIETKQLYCHSSSCIKSADYIFLDNEYDEDKSKRGVMKINKKDGSFELFKK